MEDRKKRSLLWLSSGVVLLVASHFRFGVGALAWLAPLPFLVFLRGPSGPRAHLAVVAASLLAWCLATLKIVTEPLPWIAAFGYGLPLGVVLALPYLASDVLRRRLGEGAGTLSFGALTVLAEWSLHALLPFGTWGSLVNTQLEHLALLQISSITGTHGVSALMAVSASLGARLVCGEGKSLRKPAITTAALLMAVLIYGQLRLSAATGSGQAHRRVAAVGTDSLVGTQSALPDQERLDLVEQGLVRRTEEAARSGATLVVWNEAATMVRPSGESAWKLRLQALAARLKIQLVAAYVVPIEEEPLRYENKYVFIDAGGRIDHTYLKHEPVPGEPAVRGTGPMPLVVDRGDGSVSGAICYDYDFPRLALQHAELDVDLVVLPSSDWRGIDPIHTDMAALRAIEGGHSLLRSTRFGLSAGIDPWGQSRGKLSHFDGEERVLLLHLPQRGLKTIYGQLGDWFPLICALLVAFLAWRAVGASRRNQLVSPRNGDSSSERTLQRRLAESNTSFAEILSEERRRLAEEYLKSPQISATEIAWLLGFSEQSAFSRAFKRWTGASPAAYRKGVLAGGMGTRFTRLLRS